MSTNNWESNHKEHARKTRDLPGDDKPAIVLPIVLGNLVKGKNFKIWRGHLHFPKTKSHLYSGNRFPRSGKTTIETASYICKRCESNFVEKGQFERGRRNSYSQQLSIGSIPVANTSVDSPSSSLPCPFPPNNALSQSLHEHPTVDKSAPQFHFCRGCAEKPVRSNWKELVPIKSILFWFDF